MKSLVTINKKTYLFVACAAFSFLFLGMINNSTAATFEFLRNGQCDVRLVGEIIEGDANKLNRMLDENLQSIGIGPEGQWTLCLDSEGGDFSEALKIIEFRWKDSSWSSPTLLEPNAVCLSACALIFMSGQENETGLHQIPARKMHTSSQLGFHAPSKQYPVYGKYDDEFVNSAFQQAAISISQLMAIDRNSLIPRSLLLRALQVSGNNNFIKVDSLAKMAAWEIELYGFKQPKEVRIGDLRQMCRNADYLTTWYNESGWEILDKPARNISDVDKFEDTEHENLNLIIVPNTFRELNSTISGNGEIHNKTFTVPDQQFGGEPMEFVYFPNNYTVLRAILPGYADEALSYCIVNLYYGDQIGAGLVWNAGISDTKHVNPAPRVTGSWGMHDLERSLSSLVATQ